jgi:hypothetical protein
VRLPQHLERSPDGGNGGSLLRAPPAVSGGAAGAVTDMGFVAMEDVEDILERLATGAGS